MSDLFRTILTGAIAGGIFSLIAVGLVVTYSVTNIFDLGYGGIAFTAALVYYELNSGLGWNRFLAAAFVVLLLCPLLGVALNRLIYRPLAHATDTVRLVTPVGILIGLPAFALFVIHQGIATFGWGIPNADNVVTSPGLIFERVRTWTLPGEVTFNSNQATVLVVGAVICLCLWRLFASRLGLQMLAVRDRRDLAVLRGVDERRTSLVAAVTGSTLAGIAGVVGAPILAALNPGVFIIALLAAAAAVVIGRFSSVPWTFVGGLLLGVTSNLVMRYVHIDQVPQLNQAVPFIVLLVGLLLLGRSRVRIGGSTSGEQAHTNWRADLTAFQRLRIPVAIFVGGIALAYFKFSDYWASLALRSVAVAIILLSITLITGLGGFVSLAQAAFASTAALTTALLWNNYGMSFFVAAVIGILAAVALGQLVAVPSVRLGGVPFALATLALALMAQVVLLNSDFMTNSGFGWTIERPLVGPVDLNDDRTLLIVVAVIFGVLVWAISNLRHSASGRALLAVRANEAAADSIGISGVGTRLRLFAVSSALAGLGGVLLVMVDKGVSAQSIPPLQGLIWLAAIVVLGVSRPAAAAVGAVTLVLVPALLSSGFSLPLDLVTWNGLESTYVVTALFGLAAIDLARNPEGSFDRISERLYRRRHRAQTPPAAEVAPTTVDLEALESSTPSLQVVTDAASSGQALSIVAVSSGYGLVEVIHSASFVAPAGLITVILGPNGAGKSTLCKTIAGLVTTDSGRLMLEGSDLPITPQDRCRAGVVLVPETRGVFPGLTVEDNLRLTLISTEQIEAAYDRFPVLAARAKLPAGSLSGGEQQMLSLAPSLTIPPPVLIVDEPTLGLAPMVAEQVLTWLGELRDAGTTVVLAEEKHVTVNVVADKVVLLSLGRTIWQGEPAAMPDDLVAAAYGLHAEAADAEPDTGRKLFSPGVT